MLLSADRYRAFGEAEDTGTELPAPGLSRPWADGAEAFMAVVSD